MALRDRLQACLGSRFVLESSAGGGGMALVFRARDTKLGRTVAVKLLRPELATAVGAERFLREARALAALSHPNVIPVHECGEAAGLFWYVMDFEASPTLRERLAEGPLPRREAFRLGKDLLAGLAATHASGILHRDVKPSNIFWREDRAVLADFGVAGAHAESAPGAERLTTDTTPGTFAYMAPEVVAGGEATARSDLYAAAMVIYEAFTGRRWAPGPRRSRNAWKEVPRRARPVLARGLEPDPGKRWHDAGSFRRALRRAGRRRPVGLVVLAAVVGAALVAAGAVFGPRLLRGGDRGARLTDVAVFPCSYANPGDSALADQLARTVWAYLGGPAGGGETNTSVSVTPFEVTSTAWHDYQETGVPDSVRRERLGARWGVTCSLDTYDDHWSVGVRVADGKDVRVPGLLVRTPPDAQAAATRLWQEIVSALRDVRLPEDQIPFIARYPPDAQRLYVLGLAAFDSDQLAQARDRFREALAAAPGFALAAWHLAEAQRWLAHSAVSIDLESLYATSAGKLGARDSMLLAARAEKTGPDRLRALERATEAFPRDAYATLLYGDELYHRGELWGIPIDSGVARMDASMRQNPRLAPAVEHVTQAYVRMGDSARAHEALERLRDVWVRSPGEIDYRKVWWLAYMWRFRRPAEARAALDGALAQDGGAPEAGVNLLRLGARWVRYVDLPDLQFLVGRLLEEHGRRAHDVPDMEAGRLAAGLGLLQIGRLGDACRAFDTLADAENPEFVVQTGELRVIPYALRLAGFTSDAATEAAAEGTRRLQALFRSPSTDVMLRARAAFALGLLAVRRGDAARAADWADSIRAIDAGSGTPSSTGERMVTLLGAAVRAEEGDLRGALERSASLTTYDSTAAALNPFERSVAYWLRGEWYAAEGDSDSAIRSWYWQANTDLEEGTPPGVIQAAEVDAAFGPHARAEIVRTAAGSDENELGGVQRCDLIRSRAESLERAWSDEIPGIEGLPPLDPALAALRDSVTRAARRACPSP